MRRLLFACVVVVGCGGPARPPVAAVTAPTPPAPVLDAPAPPIELLVVDAVIAKVRDEYVDGTRVDPRAMLVGAVARVQRDIAEVMSEVRATGEIEVQVNARHQVFATADVDSLAMLATRLGEILRFVDANVGPAAKPAGIELAAVNGFLATLDPHSEAMDPEEARSFKTDLSGTYGGIGMAIGIDKDAKTGQRAVVVKALIAGDTPARRAGLQVDDRIVMMDEESTAAFSLDDAMGRLRGPVDTAILLAVQRAGVDGLMIKALTRAVIKDSRVSSQLLDKQVGYVKIDGFTDNVGADAARAVEALRAQGVKGWVLDLRGNPGGAMAEAIKVADLFVDAGAIVITEGDHRTREQELATAAASDDRLPLAVLVDSGTASSGEILAGALRDLDRAVLLGSRTFGKASVQVLFDLVGGALLKLTVAQYFTATEVSLQGYGIVPDIELDPVVVPATLATATDVVRLTPPEGWHESEIEGHLTSKRAAAGAGPAEVVSYLGAARAVGNAPFAPDFEINLARDLVVGATSTSRPAMLRAATKLIGKHRREQATKITAAFAGLGIKWKAGRPRLGATLAASFTTDQPGDRVVAGATVAITGTVTNTGTAPAYRVRARAVSDDEVVDDREIAFGRIDPGATRRVTIKVAIPASAETRLDVITWELAAQGAAAVTVAPLRLAIDSVPRPQFAYSYQLVEDATTTARGAAPDGVIRPGDRFHLEVQVKNTGAGPGPGAVVQLRSGSGPGVAIDSGRIELAGLAPGQSRDVEVGFRIRPELAADEIVLELAVYDEVLATGVSDKLRFPIGSAATASASVTPPQLEVAPGPLETTAATWTLSGSAVDDTRIEDAYVMVSNRTAKIDKKVLYLSNRGGATDGKLVLAGDLPLWPGSNLITVVVRENAEVRTERTIWVYRAPPPPAP